MPDNKGQPGRAPAECEDADMALKKSGFPSSTPDIDFHEKKDSPPRFSTLFAAGSPAPPPPPPPRTPREYVREHYLEPSRRSGIYMPLPLFILLTVVLFFESTIIFAYTIIGLYNNAPSRIFPWAGPGATVSVADRQPAINIAPNFVLPQGNLAVVTVTATPTLSTLTSTTSSSSSSSSSTTSSSSSSTDTSSQAAAALASSVVGILEGLEGAGAAGLITSSSSSPLVATVTVKPQQSTVTSVKLITEDPSGNVIRPAPTTTLTTFVDPPKATSTSTKSTLQEIVIRPTTVSTTASAA